MSKDIPDGAARADVPLVEKTGAAPVGVPVVCKLDGVARNVYSLHKLAPSVLSPPEPDVRVRDNAEYREFFETLRKSIREVGILHPVIAYRDGNIIVIVDGWTRVLAALIERLGLIEVLIFEEKPTDEHIAVARFKSNSMCRQPTMIEQAMAFQDAMKRFGWTQTKVAQAFEVSAGTVSKALLGNRLPEEVMRLVASGELVARSAYAISKLSSNPEQLRELALKAVSLPMSAEAVEDQVKELLGKTPKKKKHKPHEFKFGNTLVTVKSQGNLKDELTALMAKLKETLKRLGDEDGNGLSATPV